MSFPLPASRRASAALLVLAGLTAAFACKSTSASESCDPVCAGIADCNGLSCLAYCVDLRTVCTAKEQAAAFSDWASCQPVLACVNGGFVATTCAVEVVETLACGAQTSSPPTMTSTGTGTGITTTTLVTSGGSTTVTTGTVVSTGTDTTFSSGTDTETGTGTGTGTSTATPSMCSPIGETCTAGTNCCSIYCKAGVCACNTGGFVCGQPGDCCEGFVCNNNLCVGNAQTVVTCQVCGVDGGACSGTRHCQSTGFGQTYCAQDCTTNASSCPLDMTCTASGTGTSSCIPNSGMCVAGDAG